MPQTRIFRLTHFQNLPFILQNGIHCASSPVKDPNFVNIGAKTLIELRSNVKVNIAPGGMLNDYVPFYFCTKTPMLYLLFKQKVEGFNGKQGDLIFLVSYVEAIAGNGLGFVFTDRHAKLNYANFFNDVAQLQALNWEAINSEQWGDKYDPTRMVRELKQAEFLVYQQVPIDCIAGIVCQNKNTCTFVEQSLTAAGSQIQAVVRPDFFF